MKIITVPADVKVKIGDEETDLFTFKKALIAHLDNYAEIKSVSQLRDAQKVIDAIEAGNGTISMEDEQYKLLKAACEKLVYKPLIARQLMTYYSAVEGAEDLKK